LKSLFFGSNKTAPSTSVTNYMYLSNSNLSTPSSTEAIRQLQMPTSGTIRNLYFSVDTAPGVGKSWTVVLRKNGANTGLTVTISDANTNATDSTHSMSFVAGDLLSLAITPSGTPTAFASHHWDMECNASGQPIIGGNGNTPSTSSANFSVLQGGNPVTWTVTENKMKIICPTAGTLSNLYARLSGSPNTGTSYTLTVRVNGDTVLATTISDTNTTNSNTTDTVSVAAGDALSMKVTPTSTPTARSVWWGLLFTPTNDGESIIGFGNPSLPSTSATNYEQGFFAGVNGANWDATEANVLGYIGPQTLKKAYFLLNTAPGGATSRAFTIRKNTSDTLLTATISGVSTTGNSTNDVTFARDDSFAIKSVPTSTPAAATDGLHGGFLVYNAPSTTHRVFIT